MTGIATTRALHRLSRPLRLRAGAGWLALGLGAVALLLGSIAWAIKLGWIDGPQWVLVAWIVVVVALGVVVWLAGESVGSLSHGNLARRLEDLGEWRHGTLTALLDQSARGTSEALLARADAAQATEVERRGGAAVEPIARPVRVVALAGLAVLAVGAMAFVSAGPVAGAAAALWHPARAWRALVAPVQLSVEQSVVDRGDSVTFRVEAIGRRTAMLWLRAPGEEWHPRGVRLDSLGHAAALERPADQRRVRACHQRQPQLRHAPGQGSAARISGRSHRDGPLPGVSRSRVRAGADRRRHAVAARRHPSRDERRSHRAAVLGRVGDGAVRSSRWR